MGKSIFAARGKSLNTQLKSKFSELIKDFSQNKKHDGEEQFEIVQEDEQMLNWQPNGETMVLDHPTMNAD